MSFMVGQALVYLKISVLAAAIVAVIWVLGKLSVFLYDRKNDPPGGNAPD
jgi:hypothetical protein